MILTGSATRFANPAVWEVRLARLRDHGPDLDAECALLLGPRWKSDPALDPVRDMLARTRPEGWQGLAAATATADFYQTTATLTLIVVGGLIYSVGVIFHVWERLRFQNAIWHGFVVTAAAASLAAKASYTPACT